MGECRSDARLDVARVLEPDPPDADSFGHGREIRILEFRASGGSP